MKKFYDEFKDLGIKVQIKNEYRPSSRFASDWIFYFETREDLNLYRLVGKHQQSDYKNLRFRIRRK